MKLHEEINGDYRQRHYDTPTIAGAGGWAKVVTVDPAASTVAVTVEDFDAGTLTFGPVPYWVVSSGTPPTVGQQVWLLVDSAGQASLALAF